VSAPFSAPTHVPRPRSAWRTGGAILGATLAAVYILNPTFGVFELLPDAIPGVGNLDEAAATALLIACVRALRRPRTA
jgi:uncharacterized membrane protein YkvA (DUF1232 family)